MLTEFSGLYFDGQSTKAHPVQVKWNGFDLEIQGEHLNLLFSQGSWTLQPPLARTRRVFHLPDGAKLETEDHGAIQGIEAPLGINAGLRWVNAIEGNWKWVLLGFVVLSAFLWGFFRFGLPMAAQRAAFVTPASVLSGTSQNTLKLLEGHYLRPSEVPKKRQMEIREAFDQMTGSIGEHYSYDLRFYDSPELGANAFALPSGTIVVTDALLDLAKNDRELMGVLAHEVGHVVHRHGMQSVYQSLGVFLIISVSMGDVASPTSLAASFPALLIQSGYSRDFEREADVVAGRYMLEQGWGTQPLQNILERMVKSRGGEDQGVVSLISTHPGTAERLKNLQQMQPDPH